MARASSKAAPKKAARNKAEPDSIPVRIVVDRPSDTPSYYANHIEIAINRHEIALWIARLPTKPGREEMALAEAAGEIVVDIEMEIIVPPTLIDGLITAFETTKTKYEAAFGPIREIKE